MAVYINPFNSLLSLVDMVYSEEGAERNFGSIVDVKIERIFGLDKLGLEKAGMFPEISIAGNNFDWFCRGTRSVLASLDWLKYKATELSSFAETGNSKFLKNAFTGMYVSAIVEELHYDEVRECYKISYFTYTEGEVIKKRTKERVTIWIDTLDGETKDIVTPEQKEEEEIKIEELTEKEFEEEFADLFGL